MNEGLCQQMKSMTNTPPFLKMHPLTTSVSCFGTLGENKDIRKEMDSVLLVGYTI